MKWNKLENISRFGRNYKQKQPPEVFCEKRYS